MVRKVLQRLLSIALGLTVVGLGLEVLWRVWVLPATGETLPAIYDAAPYPDVGYVVRPGSVAREAGRKVRANEYGLRGASFPLEKPADEFRILALGDSITMSAGLPLDRAYTAVLEARLNERSSGLRYRVINAGLEGYTTRQELAYWKCCGERFTPDLVLVQYFYNDPAPTIELAGAELGTGQVAWWVGSKNEIKRRSVLLTWILKRFYEWRAGRQGTPATLDLCEELYDPRSSHWADFTETLGEFHAHAEQTATPVVFLLFPLNVDLGPSHPYLRYYRQVGDALDGAGIPYFDLYPNYSPFEDEALWLRPDDWHLNVLASRLAGESIADWLEQNSYLSGTGSANAAHSGSASNSPARAWPSAFQ